MLHWAREIYIHFLEHAFRKPWKFLKKTRIFMLISCFLDFSKSWNFHGFPYIFYVDFLLFGHAFWKKLTADIWMDFQCNFMLIVCFLVMLFEKNLQPRFSWIFNEILCWSSAFWKFLCWFSAFWILCFLKIYFLIFLLSGRSTPPLYTC